MQVTTCFVLHLLVLNLIFMNLKARSLNALYVCLKAGDTVGLDCIWRLHGNDLKEHRYVLLEYLQQVTK